jgi:outer membrane lipoprotein-sorting protein
MNIMFCVLQNGLAFVTRVLTTVVLIGMSLSVSGCITAHTPVEVQYINGSVVDSFSSGASLSYATSERSISGNGFLMYRKPDQIRGVILSPFGSVLQEIYVSGDLVTIIDANNGIAFSGIQADLPAKGDLSGWRHINWLIDIDPPDSSRRNSVITRINRFGQQEQAVFANGLLVSKTTAEGGHVSYGNYLAAQGAVLPLEIIYETAAKEKFKILLEDPEINAPLTEDTFMPSLGKLSVYPLSRLK